MELIHGPVLPTHLDDVWLVVLGDRNSSLALALQELCERRCIWFCAIDQPTFNSFSHMSILDLAPLQLAIGSDGRAPALVRRLRQELMKLLDTPATRAFFERIAELRTATPPTERRAVLERELQGFSLAGQVNVPKPADPGEP
jgi:siroheme synthase-like protein